MACEARLSKTTHGDGNVVIAKSPAGRASLFPPRWDELWKSDGRFIMWFHYVMAIILWETICILLHEHNYLDLDTICFLSWCIQRIIQSRDSKPQEVFLGKARSFSKKQVLTCLVKTGNDSAIFQGHYIEWSLLTN